MLVLGAEVHTNKFNIFGESESYKWVPKSDFVGEIAPDVEDDVFEMSLLPEKAGPLAKKTTTKAKIEYDNFINFSDCPVMKQAL